MIEISTVLSSIIESGIRIVKSLVFGRTDRRTHYEAMPFGVDAVPVKNIKAVVSQTSTKEERVVLGYINTSQEAIEGEHRIYSIGSDGKTIATYLWLKRDGTIELGGGGDTAVKFSELKTAFDQLKSDFNSLVSAYNEHTHSGVTSGGGTSGTTLSTGSTSNANIDPSEAPNIKLP